MCTPVTVVLALLRVAVLVLATWPTAVAQVAHVSGRLLAQLTAQAVCPVLLELPVLHLLPVGCLGKVAAAVAVVLLALGVQVVRAVVALVVAAVVQHAVHMPQALAVSAVMAGHWWWSIDNAAICRC